MSTPPSPDDTRVADSTPVLLWVTSWNSRTAVAWLPRSAASPVPLEEQSAPSSASLAGTHGTLPCLLFTGLRLAGPVFKHDLDHHECHPAASKHRTQRDVACVSSSRHCRRHPPLVHARLPRRPDGTSTLLVRGHAVINQSTRLNFPATGSHAAGSPKLRPWTAREATLVPPSNAAEQRQPRVCGCVCAPPSLAPRSCRGSLAQLSGREHVPVCSFVQTRQP